ncbi:hypothetical protein GQ44DRAFT_610209 [Phaeosphaeriaceae sp. PMI808]|nr:hypothetical protein GQ44DRAFT_610209 [Phaeosphaeriaceae sp. PMI808]
MEESPKAINNASNSSEKRPAQEGEEPSRSKRAKYTPAAWSHHTKLGNEIDSLRQQVVALTETVAKLVEKLPSQAPAIQKRTSETQFPSSAYPATKFRRSSAPQQPQFVGPTRSAFSFNIAETSLSIMGIQTNDHPSTGPSSVASSREFSPDRAPSVLTPPLYDPDDGLLGYSCDELIRLLGIYQEEVACVHPIVETKDLISNASEVLRFIKHAGQPSTESQTIGTKDVHMMKIAIATALIHESHGKNDVSDKLINSVEKDVGMIVSASEVEIKDVQIMGMLSLYFCHTADELYSWRAIGRAARQALEMGLHRKQSLIDNFPDLNQRQVAVQVFWVVYELDRRWSFGTSLSFALNDRDIDPQLPEPGKEYPYLKAMVAYAKLCSRVWDALPPYGSSLQLIPKETEDYLDFIAQNWLESVPKEFQFRHPRLGLALRTQPRQLCRLSTLLYLRGNSVRTLVHRHHVLTPDNIRADAQKAHLVVDIAKDSIQVLVHLNEGSDIYIREQSIYHYYLLSALAVVFLAVCHAPHTFAEACRDSFIAGVELVKGFSRHCMASRRLWKSIRGLLPVVKSLGLRFENKNHDSQYARDSQNVISEQRLALQHQYTTSHYATQPNVTELWTSGIPISGFDFRDSMPDIFDMGNDLMGLYDVFGSAATSQPPHVDAVAQRDEQQGLSAWEVGEISRHFQDLI